MRKINKIIIHCSDSDYDYHDDISVINEWHLARGFKKVGYHFYIKKDGTIQIGRALWEQGAHCIGENEDSIGICLGGKYNFTDKQFLNLKSLLYGLMKEYDLYTTDIYPHNYFDKNKTCPNFDVHNF